MDTKYIELLLNKFWDATTTPEEENALHVYFNSGDVHPTLVYASVYFTIPDFITGESPDFSVKIIAALLEKYFNAETSIEEEGIISDYFSHGVVAPEFHKYSSYFSLWKKQQAVTYTKVLRLPHTNETKIDGKAGLIHMNWIKSVAAVFALALAGFWIFKTQTETQDKVILASNSKNYIEVEDPELALKYTMEALALVSKKYRKGEEQLLEGMKTMNEANVLQ